MRICRTVISSVLCGREAWSLTLKEEHRLRVHKNRVLMMIFGSNRDLVLGVKNTT